MVLKNEMLREISESGIEGAGEKYIIRSFMVVTPAQIFLL
jgi:hypothetical protein